ncbi:MAG: protein-L-isoaspartate(D-aspartate) O-methyltransferase [Ideonella sp.]|nr:protein-L-isoaspartate(D-aspartate) O-methyltransferase [Ideonella sp.]
MTGSARGDRPRFPLSLERLGQPSQRDPQPAARKLLRPQAPLEQAAADASRRVVPSGLGLDSAEVRRRMTSRLQAAGLRDERVLAALAEVPRHLFVDAALVNQAYEDTSLPIGHGQTISKPSIVARMIELLLQGQQARASGALGRVLEIGSGCGYQAALLARLSREVWSIERLRPLHDKARAHLLQLRETRVRLLHGDGMLGHPGGAPFDAIIAAAGGEALPQAWLDQLAIGGRIVAPVQAPGRHGEQALVIVDRTDNGYLRSEHESVHFVPLMAGRA